MDQKLISEISGRVATLTINRERQRNALDDETLRALRGALEEIAQSDASVVILRGQGLRSFCAGSDLKELARQNQRERIGHTDLGQALGDQIEQHPCPVIAAIEGFCLGGGLELALCCDYRIAGAGSTFGLPEVAINALPSWGGTVRLPRTIGVGRAREMILFDRRLSAEEALSWGLIGSVVPDGTAYDAATALASKIAERSSRDILEIVKGLVTHGLSGSPRAGRHLEYLADKWVLASDALESGVSSFGKK